MEPCLFRHGKDAAKPFTITGYATLQWSHVFSDMVSCHAHLSQSFPSGLQWSHVFSDMVSYVYGKGSGKERVASMEPCLFRHGKAAAVRRRTTSTDRFNGAMSFQTW